MLRTLDGDVKMFVLAPMIHRSEAVGDDRIGAVWLVVRIVSRLESAFPILQQSLVDPS